MNDEQKKAAAEAWRELMAGDDMLPIPIQRLKDDGSPDGPPITTYKGMHVSGLFSGPVEPVCECEAPTPLPEDVLSRAWMRCSMCKGVVQYRKEVNKP